MGVSRRVLLLAVAVVVVVASAGYGVVVGAGLPTAGVGLLIEGVESQIQRAAGGLLPGPAAQPQKAAPAPTTAPVTSAATAAVKRAGISQTVTAPTRVISAREVALYFKAPGQMDELLVKVGDQVRQGDAIANLMARTLNEQVSQARLNLDVSTLKVAKARAEAAREDATMKDVTVKDMASAQAALAQAELALQTARLKLDRLRKGPSPEEVTVAKGTLEKARVVLQRAQAAYDKVYWEKDIGASKEAADLEAATIDYNTALASYNLKMGGPSKEDLAIAGNDAKSAEISLARAQADYDLRMAPDSLKRYDILLAEKEVERGRMLLEQLNVQAADARIVAPFSGDVVGVMARPGETVQPFMPVIRLADPSSLEVVADIDSSTLASVTPGQKATLTFNRGSAHQLSATVSQIPGAGDQAGGDRGVRLRLDAPGDLALGMQGQATLTLQQRDNTLVVSREAVRPSGTRTYARVLRGDVVEQVEVRTGIQNEEMVEVLSGLKEGDQVVVR